MISKSLYIVLSILLIIFISCKKDSISTKDPFERVTDVDGNVYKTLKIGSQIWMVENLKAKHYRNGEPIPEVTITEWVGLKYGAYCKYNNDESNVETYGLLYNWYAVVDSQNLAPQGWHVPTDDEWKELEIYLGVNQNELNHRGWRGVDEGGKLKEKGTSHWFSPNTGASNISGFTALPSGSRGISGSFGAMMSYGYFWSSTESASYLAWFRSLGFDTSSILRFDGNKPNGISVRCIKD